MTIINEIIQGVTFWKLGCNWGSNERSFYRVICENHVVIGIEHKGVYKINDLILVTEGHPVRAIARIKSKPIRLSSNKKLTEQFNKYNVDATPDISYYEVELYHIPSKDIFKYKLQQGIVHVRNQHMKKIASKIWSTRKIETKPDNRIMRITWNSNNWEKPSGHLWREKNQGNTNIAHENQYGYGHEEWLFNDRYRINGFQYGFIRGINNLSIAKESIDKIVLYTIRDDKQRCIVGTLKNVEIIEGFDVEQDKVVKLIKDNEKLIIQELKDVNANYEHYKQDKLLPNVKFKWEEAELYPNPIPVNFLDGSEYNRFQAYYLEDNIEKLILKEDEVNAKFEFNSGKASQTDSYTKNTSKNKTTVDKSHSRITEDLYNFSFANGSKKSDLSLEKTRVGSNIVDFAIKMKDGYELYEIKTNFVALKNIRQGLGQLLEYAFTDSEINIKKLVIVGPAKLKENEKEYWQRICKKINVCLEYWAYNKDEKEIQKKFIKQ